MDRPRTAEGMVVPEAVDHRSARVRPAPGRRLPHVHARPRRRHERQPRLLPRNRASSADRVHVDARRRLAAAGAVAGLHGHHHDGRRRRRLPLRGARDASRRRDARAPRGARVLRRLEHLHHAARGIRGRVTLNAGERTVRLHAVARAPRIPEGSKTTRRHPACTVARIPREATCCTCTRIRPGSAGT
ncbi:hypothetical protein EMIT0158MI4_140049 [Burkholderia ambifaria]